MEFLISAKTDIGNVKETNQDCFLLKRLRTEYGEMVFAVLCDGMGGLAKGEVASASVIRSFDEWLFNDFPYICNSFIEDSVIKSQWENIINVQNRKIKSYGENMGINLGTTVIAMLITQNRYYILNIGDSRVYEITNELRILTNDQTFVAREVELGHMTIEEAENDPRRSVLLQCCGASENVYPDMFFGDVKSNSVYMICSDGFRHMISANEIFENLNGNVINDVNSMENRLDYLIDLNKQRQERDNITALLIKAI